MKNKAADNRLVLITLIAVSLSLFSISLPLARLDITGASSSEDGYVNITIVEAADITVVRAQINFTDSMAGDNKDSTDSSNVDSCDTDLECGINITNVGNTEVNITIQNTEPLFDDPTAQQENDKYYTYNVTMYGEYAGLNIGGGEVEGEHNCSVGYSRGLEANLSGWRATPVTGEEVAICYLNYTEFKNWAQVDINITIPYAELGGSKGSKITFTGYLAY